MATTLSPLMQAFLNPPAKIGSWPQGLFNDGRFERESVRIEAAKAVGEIAIIIRTIGEAIADASKLAA
jgi:hypothetical protein